jgi:hypothetical protein
MNNPNGFTVQRALVHTHSLENHKVTVNDLTFLLTKFSAAVLPLSPLAASGTAKCNFASRATLWIFKTQFLSGFLAAVAAACNLEAFFNKCCHGTLHFPNTIPNVLGGDFACLQTFQVDFDNSFFLVQEMAACLRRVDAEEGLSSLFL